jgi:4-hydroxy-L-threonine phosphate dehydrogenase PdxA
MSPVAITEGDVAGIGPEIVIRMMVQPEVLRLTPAFVIGPIQACEWTARAWVGASGANSPHQGRQRALAVAGLAWTYSMSALSIRTCLT